MAADEIRSWRRTRAKTIILPVAGILGLALLPALAPVPQAVAADAGEHAATDSPAVQPPRSGPTDYSPVIRQLSTDIRALMDQHKVVGLTITLVDGRRVAWTKGFGFADQASKKKVTANTLFPIGSVTKTLTAAAVMQLVERGLVNLDDPLSKYVPGFRLRPRYRGNVITVRSVLDHHSGIPGDVLNGLITSRRPDPGFRPWLLRALRQMYPERPVNTVWAYSNSAYVLLQNLVEHVTGLGLEQYARRYLFGPMRMNHTYFDPVDVPVRRLTREYLATFDADGQATGAQLQPREFVNGWGAGSVTSSAADMSRYLRMLVAGGAAPGGQVLRGSTLRQMWTPQTHTVIDKQANYVDTGLGWFPRDPGLDWMGRNVSHNGATVYVQSALRVLPRSDIGVFVSINTASTGGLNTTIADEAISLAYSAKSGIAQPPPAQLPDPPASSLSQAALARHAGSYAGNRTLGTLTVADGKLVLDDGTGAPIAFSPTSAGWFKPDQADQPQISFRTVAGRHLMLVRLPTGPAIKQGVVSERVSPSPQAARWQPRFGSYRATDANPLATPGLVPAQLTLGSQAGIMTLRTDLGVVQALRPASGKLAFTAGLGIELARAEGDCVVAGKTRSGTPSFTYLGVRYVRTGPAKAAPAAPAPWWSALAPGPDDPGTVR